MTSAHNKGESFYGYTLATDTEEQLVTWINSDVDSNNISSACLTENGDIVCLSSEYSSSGDGTITYFITLKKTPYDQVPQKTTLTLACVYLDYRVKSQILDFNRKSSDYRIEVRDYSEFNTDDDYSAGLTKLITEIGSGAVPDILVTSSLPMDVFGNKGLFEDLWPYIEADEELGGPCGRRGALLQRHQRGRQALSDNQLLHRAHPRRPGLHHRLRARLGL